MRRAFKAFLMMSERIMISLVFRSLVNRYAKKLTGETELVTPCMTDAGLELSVCVKALPRPRPFSAGEAGRG